MKGSIAVITVLFVLVAIVSVQAKSPTECRSFVSLGDLTGSKEIGPGAVVTWDASQAKADLPCVSSVYCQLKVFDTPVADFTLTTTNVSHPVSYTFGKIFGNGVFTLFTGCEKNGPYVPQLRVDFVGEASGGKGGMNGSVAIFDMNTPAANDSLAIGPVELRWTACVDNSGPGTAVLLNATLWTVIDDLPVGAAFVDLQNPVQSGVFGMGAYWGPNVTVTYEYIGTGVMQETVVCMDVDNCAHNHFELFSVFS
jgi:hypothetical protein